MFFTEFVAKMEAFTEEFLETIEAKAHDVAMLAGERVLTNIHLIDPAFPFAELVKPLGKGTWAEASRAATAIFVEELVGVFAPDNDGDALEDSTQVWTRTPTLKPRTSRSHFVVTIFGVCHCLSRFSDVFVVWDAIFMLSCHSILFLNVFPSVSPRFIIVNGLVF